MFEGMTHLTKTDVLQALENGTAKGVLLVEGRYYVASINRRSVAFLLPSVPDFMDAHHAIKHIPVPIQHSVIKGMVGDGILVYMWSASTISRHTLTVYAHAVQGLGLDPQ